VIQENNSYGRDQITINNPQGSVLFRDTESLREILVIGIDSTPPSIRNWIDRESIQRELLECVEAKNHFIGIVGIGGFGKSSLAAWLFQNLSSSYQKSLWIKLPREIPFSQFARWLLQEIGFKVIGDQHSDQDLALEILRRLRERQYLIIIDQLETLASFESWSSYKALLSDWLNRGGTSTFLFTARDKICGAGSWIHLRGLEPNEIYQILSKDNIAIHKLDCINLLKAATDGHPLLINLVITWLKSHKKSLGKPELTLEDIRFFENLFRGLSAQTEIKVKEVFKTLFQQLPHKLRILLTSVSVYRSAFSLEEAQALVPEAKELDLTKLSKEAFLLPRPEDQRWSLHPLIQKLLYEELNLLSQTRVVHQKAGIFFYSKIIQKKISPEDCQAEIEAFHHFCSSHCYFKALQAIECSLDFLNQSWGGYGLPIPLLEYLIVEWSKERLSVERELGVLISLVHLGDSLHAA
jgi:hypothetical protein